MTELVFVLLTVLEIGGMVFVPWLVGYYPLWWVLRTGGVGRPHKAPAWTAGIVIIAVSVALWPILSIWIEANWALAERFVG